MRENFTNDEIFVENSGGDCHDNRKIQEQEVSAEIPEDNMDFNEAENILIKIIEQSKKARIKCGEDCVFAREKAFGEMTEYEKTLRSFLERLGVTGVDVRKVGHNLFRIDLRKSKNLLHDLPKGYGFKGGYARSILLFELGLSGEIYARDVDAVRIINKGENLEDDAVSKKYSLEDFEQGHGVEILEEEYFETRDFTINEVLVSEGSVFLTKQCLLDTVRRIVRFSEYEKQRPNNPIDGWDGGYFINDKLMAKAIRLCASESLRGRSFDIADKDAFQHLEIKDFHFALHLDRALSEGFDVAVEYLRRMQEAGQLPKEIDDPVEFLRNFILSMQEEGSFVFRNAPSWMFDKEEEFFEELVEFVRKNRPDAPRSDVLLYSDLMYGEISEEFERQIEKNNK